MADFNPAPGDQLTLDGDTYRVSPHPSVPTFAFGQEGRKAFVFQLEHTRRRRLVALKKFKPAFRHPALADICRALAQYAHLPGMSVCRRECLAGPAYKSVLREYPDLEYAVLMPWMNGSTWYDFVVSQTAIDPESSLQMAWKTSLVLAALEEAGVAHCDIAGPNVVIDMDVGEVHLVDVEDIYAAGMPPPQAVPAGTDGYNHLTADAGLWGSNADRFAGAVLLAEMLGWHNPAVRDRSDEEHYFALHEMQQDCDAYRLLSGALYDTSPALAELFERAWFSPTLDDCPPLAEWAAVLDPLARPSPVREWVPLGAIPGPAAPHPGNWEPPPQPVAAPTPGQSASPAQHPTRSLAQPPAPGGPLVGFRPIELDSLPPAEPTPPPDGETTPTPTGPPPAPEADPHHTARPLVEAPSPPDEDIAGQAQERPAARRWLRLPLRLRREATRSPAGEQPPASTVPEAAEESEGSLLLIGPPARPQLSISPSRSDGGYVLTWNAVPEATYYVLQESTRMGFSEGKQATVRGATEWRVGQRPPGTYYYRVRAHTDEDFGEWSNIVFTKVGPPES